MIFSNMHHKKGRISNLTLLTRDYIINSFCTFPDFSRRVPSIPEVVQDMHMIPILCQTDVQSLDDQLSSLRGST